MPEGQPTQTLSDEVMTYPLAFEPGVRRDGTRFETNQYRDAQNVRWHMGRARKMGGFRQITASAAGKVYSAHVYPLNGLGYAHMGMPEGVQQIQIDQDTGLGSGLVTRTPAGYTTDADNLWTFITVYDDAVGTKDVQILAHVAPNLSSIDQSTGGTIYSGSVDATGVLTSITDSTPWPPGTPGVAPNAPTVSGGICAIAPYVFAYGSDGFVGWCDANQPTIWETGDAGSDRVTDKKIVYGTAARGGQVPSGVFWSLDSLIRATYVGGSSIFSFTTVTDKTSILSSRGVIEYDNVFYWPGKDRFLYYDGVVRELPNTYNADWFFEGLNQSQRQKVWGYKNTRFGEIWWFFPKDSATDCTHAVVYNVRSREFMPPGYWYDTALARLGGYDGGVFRWPIMGCAANRLWLHEYGYDQIAGSSVSPLETYFETSDIAYPSTGPGKSGWVGQDRWTKLLRVEPDWRSDQSGDIVMTVKQRRYAMDTDVKSVSYTLAQGTQVKDMKDTGRLMGLKFYSNTQGGFFQQGQLLIHVGPDDGRQ